MIRNMIKELMKNCLLGFIFGTVIALVAYFGRFSIPFDYIIIMPFFFAGINLLGSTVAMLVVVIFTIKNLVREKHLNIIGFLTAAIVNTLLAFAVIVRLDESMLRTDFVFLYFAGMAMGAIYGVYRYRNDLANERIQFLEELADKNHQLQDASRMLAITSEHNKMSRDLHDSISQGLHALAYSVYSLRNQLKNADPEIIATLDHIEATAKSTQDELRAIIEALKPSILEKSGLTKALETMAHLFSQRQNIPVDLEIDLSENITPQIEFELYRIAQEAFANIEKHASARKVMLSLNYSEPFVQLIIKDDGNGFDTRKMSSGHGLRNMKFRAEEAGGTLVIISKLGLGTSVIASLPVESIHENQLAEN